MAMRRRSAITLVLAAAACALGAPEAVAAGPFKPCAPASPLLCASLTVPLDRSGATPGTVKLRVVRLRAGGRRDGVLLALAGGPGEAATPYVFDWAFDFRSALQNRDLVVFDQRGTGLSGALRCRGLFSPAIRTPADQAAAAERCAQEIGPRRAFYTTRDSVEDIDAVRRAVGVHKLTLFGVSYGTKVALAYAAKYPQHVERLMLDSIVEPRGPGPFWEETFTALPRVLRTLCLRGCEEVTKDLMGDLSAVLGSMRNGLLYGPLVGADGRRQRARIGRLRLFYLLLAGDFDPTLRAGLPAALRAARSGDTAPLLRLALRSERGSGPSPAEFLSDALFVATTCEEGPLPWDRTTPPEARRAVAEERLRRVPPAVLGPFDRTTALFASPLQICSRWPLGPVEPQIPDGPFPAVPALVLAGEDDLRTPLESARRIAARIPGSTLVPVPETGHSVLSGFPRRCGLRAADDFLAGRAVRPCLPRARAFPPLPPFPRSLSQVDPEPQVGGLRGRTVTAVGLTLLDALDQLISASQTAGPGQTVLRVGGLRAGYVRAGEEDLEAHGIVYVPGVRLRGRITFSDEPHGVMRITGDAAARGRLVFRRDGSVTGRLDGKRVRVAAASGAGEHGPVARGGIRGALRQLGRWPVDVPAMSPGRSPLPALPE